MMNIRLHTCVRNCLLISGLCVALLATNGARSASAAPPALIATTSYSQAFLEDIPCLGGLGELRYSVQGVTRIYLDEMGTPSLRPQHKIAITFEPDAGGPIYEGRQTLANQTFFIPTFVFEETDFTFYQFDIVLSSKLRGSDGSRETITGPAYAIFVLVFNDGTVSVGAGGDSVWEYDCLE
jgi:hypothetical protein